MGETLQVISFLLGNCEQKNQEIQRLQSQIRDLQAQLASGDKNAKVE